MKNIFLHIGTHKTGSTSLQRWLSENESLLNENGYGLYKSTLHEYKHVELYLATMRYDRNAFGKLSISDIEYDENFTSKISDRVQGFISKCPEKNVILTTEGLSLLRFEDEIQRLKRVLGPEYENIKIILYLRNKKAYLTSYRLQLKKKKGREPSIDDYWSALYVNDDTWLKDYQQLINAYSNVFGRNNIIVIDYDKEVKSRGNIIPSFVRSIGLECSEDVEEKFETYYRNSTLGLSTYKLKWYTLLGRIKQKIKNV